MRHGRLARAAAAAVAMLVWLGPTLARPEPTPAAHCTASRARFARPAQPSGGVVVPVIVHYMIVVSSRPDGSEPSERRADNQRVRRFGKRIEKHFRPPTGNTSPTRWNVNDLWLPAGIQFHLVRTETCKYLVDEVGAIPVPIPTLPDMELFLRLNGEFNAGDFKGVDVYVWPSFTDQGGFGSPRVSKTGPVERRAGGLWTKAGLFEDEGPYRQPRTLSPTDPGLPFDSVLLIAHELGHFLSLVHRCSLNGPPPRCSNPGTNDQLMSAWADGTALSSGEQDAAKTMLQRMGVD